MGHIIRRPNRPQPWLARYRGPDGKERARSFARKADAQRWLAEVEHAKHRGTWTDPALGRVHFGTWLDEWQRTIDVRPSTRVRDELLVRLPQPIAEGDQ
jgi:hypothetical protein